MSQLFSNKFRMDKNKLREEITALIDSIKKHSDEIGDSEHMPQLELELILSKIKSLYEKSIVLNYLNSSEKKIDPRTTIEEKIFVEISKKEEALNTEKQAKIATQEQAVVAEEKTTTIEPVVNPITSTPPNKTTDIRSLIGINDKFQYANELFSGNMQEYEIAIQQLNSSEDHESAMVYFNSLLKLYNWDQEQDTVKRLSDTIRRKYS